MMEENNEQKTKETIKGPKMTFVLKQQTPMIHFQFNEPGACLRASEVKPKLDKYIVNKVGKENIPSAWRISDDNFALNYKMRIETTGTPEVSHTIAEQLAEREIKRENQNDLNKQKKLIKDKQDELREFFKNEPLKIHGLYFGNMCSKNATEDEIKAVFKETVFYKDDVKVIIICFNEGLRDEIKELFPSFIAVTNFGTRQDKGFGSFISKDMGDPIENVKKSGKPYYYIKNNEYSNYEKALNNIQLVYGFMKSGFNYTNLGDSNDTNYIKGYIFSYFLKKNINNDKAFSKQQVLKLNENSNTADHTNSNYVRGLLGVSEGVDYKKGNSLKNEEHNVKILSADGTVSRFASPITFKVIGEYIFIILEDWTPILGHEFYFVSEKELNKVKEQNKIIDAIKEQKKIIDALKKDFPDRKISVPDNFNLNEFIDDFVDSFNDKTYCWGHTKNGTEITVQNVTNSRLKDAKKIEIIKGESYQK